MNVRSSSKARGKNGHASKTARAQPAALPDHDDGMPVAVAPAILTRGARGLFTPAPAGPAPLAAEPSPRFFGPQHVFPNRVRRGLGWLRDLPDLRDMTLERVEPSLRAKRDAAIRSDAAAAYKRVSGGIREARASTLPRQVDNRRFCSPVEDQGQLGSCTANACVGMVEYMERRSGGQFTDGSRLFVYKATRKLLGWNGDTGAFLRTTMKALVNFGVPPEEFWPYEVSTFDQEPDPFLYAFASNTKAISYLRLDPPGTRPAEILESIKAAVARGFAVMFGFSVYSSLTAEPDIPFPGPTDTLEGGHAVLIVGYDDRRPCRDGAGHAHGKGAFLIRNSWGQDWGDAGYGWLPYDYVHAGLADDFWTCFKLAWIESGQFD
jgi:C1A family cysteine protease